LVTRSRLAIWEIASLDDHLGDLARGEVAGIHTPLQVRSSSGVGDEKAARCVMRHAVRNASEDATTAPANWLSARAYRELPG